MTPEARRALATTIRALRARLLDDLHAATESAYRLAARTREAGLNEAARTRRCRLEAWIAEQRRAEGTTDPAEKAGRLDDDFRREAEKQAAYTLINRLVILRLMEAPGPDGRPLRTPAAVTGGWDSPAYKHFRQLAPVLAQGDDSEGYGYLLQLVFEDVATELPGLYGPAGVADLVPIPAATLRHVVDALDSPRLESCWTDDMTLGWIYQYWNDPERKQIDDRLDAGDKLQPYEIASKTQMFTERYIVDWLLQNSLGPIWLAMCRKHGWTPAVEALEADGHSVLRRLEQRRVEWRRKRDAGEVPLTELMPLHTDAEQRWAYYLPQPIPEDAAAQAPETVRDLRILDPAVGSGHFLVVAMDLLFALYREEARHRGAVDDPDWTARVIVERMLSHNLHGIDLDPRAVQIAAAALWLKARRIVPDARPERLNLVASNLRLTSLAEDDPALVELRQEVENETGIPGTLTDTIVHALRGADHLGSLLKVDRAVDQAIAAHEETVASRFDTQQQHMFHAAPPGQGQIAFEATMVRRTLLDRIETFLGRHTGGDDLGLRLRGQQLAAGVRFVRMVREGSYDLVIANPPYQATSKMADAAYLNLTYSLPKDRGSGGDAYSLAPVADLYAAFLLRGRQLARKGGTSSMLTMRNWMFIKQFSVLREHLLSTSALRTLGDFDRGAFEDVPDEVVSVTASVFRDSSSAQLVVAVCPTPREDRSRDYERTARKRAGTLCHVGRDEFYPGNLKVVPKWPIVYWWTAALLRNYGTSPLLKDVAPARKGLDTGDNVRFVRNVWEVSSPSFVPFIQGGKGRVWFEPQKYSLSWHRNGLAIKVAADSSTGANIRNERFYFQKGVAFTLIGADFCGRLHRVGSVIGGKGSSVYSTDLSQTVCLFNSSRAKFILESLNPGIGFEVGDVNRLPNAKIWGAAEVVAQLDSVFSEHEAHRETSVEFRRSGGSAWRRAQPWAQAAVDRPEGVALTPYEPEYDAEPSTDHLSFAVGVALGRFGAAGEGILDSAADDLSHALPDGILFLDTTLDAEEESDSLGHTAATPLHETWTRYRQALETTCKNLRQWLAFDFFADVHKGTYENRPIHWPLSSPQRSFVAWVNIHRFTEQTLRILLADHLYNPTLTRIDGDLNDLRATRDASDPVAARSAEKRYAKLLRARDELLAFIAAVEQCADRGAPPTDPKCPPRDQDARYAPDLDDGVMINAAALWPLLEPQWKAPKMWWKELAEAKGTKDYDWSHLSMRYWPTRVDQKCQRNPSLAVAHGCFWRYHPARAWAWELRLQDEIGPEFRIDEAPYRPGGRDVGDGSSGSHRDAWLRHHAPEALAAVEKEAVRRIRRRKGRQAVREMRILEHGLWSSMAADVWDMELRLSKKQGVEFRLLAPDEPTARAAYEAVHPHRVVARRTLLDSLVPSKDWFDEENDDEIVPADEFDDDADAEADS